MGFLRLVFTINYINVVQTYRKQKFRHASVASLGIGAREVSSCCAAKACLAYRRTHGTQASGISISLQSFARSQVLAWNGVGFGCRASDSMCDF